MKLNAGIHVSDKHCHCFANLYVIIYCSSISPQTHFWKITEAVEVVSGNPHSHLFQCHI